VNDLKKVRLSIWYCTRMIQVPVPYYCVRVDFITGASRPCTAGIVPCSARAVLYEYACLLVQSSAVDISPRWQWGPSGFATRMAAPTSEKPIENADACCPSRTKEGWDVVLLSIQKRLCWDGC